ncbi:AzlC family ABC transporter permease [Inediibacterium massiliense]|uniref:AzlC family ABC transporter permease n=1 Tax=Inediibacterium massiliense TaxID=1658111 RepID=UPI0006B64BE5|nr:AzlC family ABC transporter permease [Inediibacterium massiliense]
MQAQCIKKLSRRDGFMAGVPIFIGYFPIAMAFGILSKTVGISMKDSFLLSVFVFGGASQFIALNLLTLGVGIGEIVVTTLLVNFRYFLMSASLATKMTDAIKKWIPLIAFGVTDEIFSIASFKCEEITKEFMLPLQFLGYFSWVTGTIVGYWLGGILPENIKDSMGIALYAMFIAILIPEAKKSKLITFLIGLSGFVNTLLKKLTTLPQGWTLIVSIISVSLLGSCLLKEEEVNGDE